MVLASRVRYNAQTIIEGQYILSFGSSTRTYPANYYKVCGKAPWEKVFLNFIFLIKRFTFYPPDSPIGDTRFLSKAFNYQGRYIFPFLPKHLCSYMLFAILRRLVFFPQNKTTYNTGLF